MSSKLDAINQTRDRTPMPRPVMFTDKTKYDRNNTKDETREEEDEWWLDEVTEYDD